MGSLCGSVTTYNIGIWFVCQVLVGPIDPMSLLSVYFKSEKKLNRERSLNDRSLKLCLLFLKFNFINWSSFSPQIKIVIG